MALSQKCLYALRAVFELAKRQGEGPMKIAMIADNQAIPVRFLENILRELKHGGFVSSVRGKDGGYVLLKKAENLSMGTIIQFVDGSLYPVNCMDKPGGNACPFDVNCVFQPVWNKAHHAMMAVYNSTTFADLAEQERAATNRAIINFSI